MKELISIIYFSGTGGVKKISAEFKKQLEKKKYIAFVCELNKSSNYKEMDKLIIKSKFVFLFFPVHAFDAPKPVYDWIEETKVSNQNTVVISVSGGGEGWPNTGSRVNCITALEIKEYRIIYEKMMVMPSNWTVNTNNHLAMHLIKSIPEKTEKILNAVLSGKIRRSNIKKGGFQSFFSKMGKKSASKFVKTLMIKNSCTNCFWCVKNCPAGNIEVDSGKPYFSDKCIMCFRCIYGCPSKAIISDNFMVLKSGYSLKELEKKMSGVELDPVKKCGKGILWAGVRNYLSDKDGY